MPIRSYATLEGRSSVGAPSLRCEIIKDRAYLARKSVAHRGAPTEGRPYNDRVF